MAREVSIRFRPEAFVEGCQSLGTLEEVLEEAGLTPSPPPRGEGWGEGAVL